jgi:hypothetical protein
MFCRYIVELLFDQKEMYSHKAVIERFREAGIKLFRAPYYKNPIMIIPGIGHPIWLEDDKEQIKEGCLAYLQLPRTASEIRDLLAFADRADCWVYDYHVDGFITYYNISEVLERMEESWHPFEHEEDVENDHEEFMELLLNFPGRVGGSQSNDKKNDREKRAATSTCSPTDPRLFQKLVELATYGRVEYEFAQLGLVGIIYIGDLVQKTEPELREIKMLKTTIRDVKKLLKHMGLSLGMKLDNWNPKNKNYWRYK